MKKELLKFTLLIVCLLSSIAASAYDFESGGIYYNITSLEDKTVEVTNNIERVNGVIMDDTQHSYGDVVIPESVTYEETTYSVTNIGEEAFQGCTGLTSVTIPNSVKSICEYAFYSCSSMRSVEIPNSVTSIGVRAFSGCTRLTSITIPNSVTNIGWYAFSGCIGLTSIEIPNSVTEIGKSAFSGCIGLTEFIVDSGNNNYTALDGVLFNKNKSSIVAYPYAKSPIYTIPNSVTSIGKSAFEDCIGLTSITIPNSVTSICESAFEDCIGLTSITIPNSVTEIGRNAFSNCSGLTSVTIPNSVTSIGIQVFSACSSLTSVVIPNSVTKIDMGAFGYCTGLTSVEIPNSVTLIGWNAFDGCEGLTSVVIPNSVTEIDEHAFYDCPGLKKFIVDSGNKNYSALDGVLFNKDQTTIVLYPNAKSHKYTIPNSVTEIGKTAFLYCQDLKIVTIPNSVTKIGFTAFDFTPWYQSHADGVVYAGLVAYKYKGDMPSGTSITIKEGTKAIGDGAFYEHGGLTSVTIPNSVINIGGGAFGRCTELASVTIPNSVTKIGEFAFYNCTNLKKIYNYSESPQSISENTFEKADTQTCILYVPKGTVEAYKASDYWKDFLNIKEFKPKKVVKK